jgi:hypothetical protein
MVALLSLSQQSCAQETGQIREIPKSYQNLSLNDSDQLVLRDGDGLVPLSQRPPRYSLGQMRDGITGTDEGLAFNFRDPKLNGRLYYGFIAPSDARYPYPVYFKRYARIEDGRCSVDILNRMSGKYDMVGWQESGQARLGYRVVNERGELLYDGKIQFTGQGPFEVALSVVEGPTVHQVTDQTAVLAFETNREGVVRVRCNGKSYASEPDKNLRHEVPIRGLKPDTRYGYQVIYEPFVDSFHFRTAPKAGSREAFVFAYASDSRAGRGGGERDIYGTNAYIMKRIFALARDKEARFMQFTGDLINGYLASRQETRLQYANWKRSVEPFAHYLPYYANMGNHEALIYSFGDRFASIDQFPFETRSAEAVFAQSFTNPVNGPESEDGSALDPDPNTTDFPSYAENAFSYRYDNVGMIVLNSDYWYAPSTVKIPLTGGNPHGYIMDQQLAWLEETVAGMDADTTIDHVFVTQHTPVFPNGGHVDDDMWYNGKNQARPFAGGKAAAEGIIERRDAYLDIVVNQSSKVKAILTGDEHNFNYLRVDDAMPRYPEDWEKPKLTLKRPIYQINNGAAGAPYYAQEKTPWMDYCQSFSTQNALVLFYVDGKSLKAKIYNPDTLELFEEITLDTRS